MKVITMNLFKLLSAIALVVLLAPGCNKKDDTIAIITIVDQNDIPIAGAYVKLYGTPTFPVGDPTRLDQEAMTDPFGQARFDYTDIYHQGQAGFAVMDILTYKDSLAGEGIIKIIEEETTNETVMVFPMGP